MIQNRVFRNFLSLGIAQTLSSVLQLLILPFVIYRIGLQQFGVVSVAQVVMFYLATLTDYSFNQSATREVSLNRFDKEYLALVFKRTYIVKLILCIVSFAILLMMALVVPFISNNFELYCMAFVFVLGYASQPVWFLQGLEKANWLSFLTLGSRIVFIALVFLFINNPTDSKLFLLFFGIGYLVTGIISAVYCFRLLPAMPSVGIRDITKELGEGWHITATNLSLNTMQYGNLFILRLFTGDIVAGSFSAAERIFFTMKQGLTLFSQVSFPALCRLMNDSVSKPQVFFRKTFIPFFIFIAVGSFIVFLFSGQILSFILKEENNLSVYALRLLSMLVPAMCIGLFPAMLLLATDKRRTYFQVFITGMVLNVVANVFMAKMYGANGTIAAIYMTEIFIAVYAWIVVRKNLGLSDKEINTGYETK